MFITRMMLVGYFWIWWGIPTRNHDFLQFLYLTNPVFEMLGATLITGNYWSVQKWVLCKCWMLTEIWWNMLMDVNGKVIVFSTQWLCDGWNLINPFSWKIGVVKVLGLYQAEKTFIGWIDIGSSSRPELNDGQESPKVRDTSTCPPWTRT